MNIESINSTSGDNGFTANIQPAADVNQSVANAAGAMTSVGMDSGTSVDNAADMLVTKAAKGDTSNNEEDASALKDMKDINKIINHNTIAEFGYNEPTKRITIKIKDKETDEVIKEIPSEKALKMLAKAWELAGIMVDEKR